jgi:hypothetical protein
MKMSELMIASKIKQGKDFTVETNSERKKALMAAKYLGFEIMTKKIGKTYRIHMASEIED